MSERKSDMLVIDRKLYLDSTFLIFFKLSSITPKQNTMFL